MLSKTRKYLQKLIFPICGIMLLFLVWQLASYAASVPSILPSPIACVRSSVDMLLHGYWRDILATSIRAVSGWLLAVSLGVPVGLTLGYFRKLYACFNGPLSFLRSIPAFILLLIPTALGLSGELVRMSTIAFTGFLITADECAGAMMSMPPDRIDLVKTCGGRSWHVLTKVVIFEAFGRTVLPSAKTTLSICLIVTIVVESFSIPENGVGARLLTAMSGVEMAAVYGFILLTGALGFVLNALVSYTASRIIFWTRP